MLPKAISHLVVPGFEQSRGLPLGGETIQDFIERMEWDFKIPTICLRDGLPVLRSEWAVTPVDVGNVNFLSRPYGGGGGSGGGSKAIQIAGIVGMIALAAIAPWAAGILAPVLGITSTAGISALAAGISLGGGMLISTLVKVLAGGQNSTTSIPDAAQVYSLSAAGNTAKPLAAIPVNYGKLKMLPDYGSTPWSEYISNNQYLNLQLTIGVGKHEIHQVLIDDSILWDSGTGFNPAFLNVEIQFCNPGEPITLFPTNIEQSSEVSGQELIGPNPDSSYWVGGFIANDSGTKTSKIFIDVAFPGGLYWITADGDYHTRTVNIIFDYREVDDSGTPIGPWTAGLNTMVTDMTKTPLRYTYTIDVPSGRYEVRGNRANLPNAASLGQVITNGLTLNGPGVSSAGSVGYTLQQNTNGTIQDQVVWLGLRTAIDGSTTFQYEQNIAIRIMADDQLSSSSSRQFGVIATRIIPVWDGSAMVDTATQNPLWAFWDAATNTLYGAKRPISKVDFQTVIDMAAAADSRGDTFNYRFTDFVTVPEALDTILAPTRSKHCWVGDVLTVVRDEWKPIPSLVLTDNQIVRGTLEVVSIFNDESGIDAIIGEFLNESTWRSAETQFPPNSMSFTATNPSRIRIPGVTNPDQMHREVAFMWRQSQLRRTKVTLQTGHEGRMLKLMSAVKVQSYLPQKWGQSGEIVSKNIDGVTLTTNRHLVFDDVNTNYIEFRDKRGRYFGPIICHPVFDNDMQILVDATDLATVETSLGMTLDDALARMDGAEPPVFVLGIQGSLSRNCIVLTGKPNGDVVDLTLVVDTADVHSTDVGTTPTQPDPPLVLNPAIPVPTLLYATFRVGVAEPILDATWWPAKGALGYHAQVSYNDGNSWEQIYEGVYPGFSKNVNPAGLILRVSAFNTIKGPWVQVQVDAPTIVIAPGVVAPSSLVDGLHDYVIRILSENDAVAASIRQIVSAAVADLDAHTYSNQQELRRNLVSVFGDATASFNEAITVATGPGSAIAVDISSLTASVGTLTSSVSTNSTAIANVNGRLAAAWGVTLDVNNYITGMEFLNDGTTSAVVFNTDNFSIAKPGILTPTTIFSLQTVNGVTTMALKGDFIADGIITAQMIQVGTITADRIQTGTITATQLAAGSITTTKLAAGSVDTTALAVNGVALANIIDGATSNTGSVATSPNTSSTTQTIGTLTVDIQQGRAILLAFVPNSGNGLVTLQFFIDGVARHLYQWIAPDDSGLGSQNGYCPGSLVIGDYTSGLTAGNHTFVLQGRGKQLDVGTLVVLNPRR